ncbi:MAG TPA: hypothetical protein VGM31_23330 [Puia sp.]|jgi:hypothetical protein
MYNPFPLLTTGLLKDQVDKGKRWFVRQSFPRGMEARLKAAFLIRGYEAEEKGLAEQHLQALQTDRNAFLYDATDPGHWERLNVAAGQPFGYKVFYAAKKGVDWKPPALYQQKIRRYINQRHPNWRAQHEGGEIQVGLYEEFGELFLKFSHGHEEDMIIFETIEQY